jgi:hypothetical protein
VRKPLVVLLTALLWMAATAGATEPGAKEVDPTPALDTPEIVPPPPQGNIQGKVTQTMDVAQYTYVEVDTGKGLLWAAGPLTPVKVGDSVELSNTMSMTNFHSTALDRTFDKIHLASKIQVKSH